MKKKNRFIVLVIVSLLLSFVLCACGKENSGDNNNVALSTTSDKKTEVKQDSGNAGNSSAQEPGTNNNQYTNNVSTDKKPSQITLVKVQVNNAPANANPFHVSLDGQVGASAAKLTPGSSTMLQKDVYETGGKYPITLTISRNGATVAVINQNLNSSNVSVVITETAPNQFKAQWN